MHNAAFEKLGLDYLYVPFHVKQADLSHAVAGMKALNLKGFNVTIPHKVAVISLLEKIDPVAARIGAVNTVVNENGCWCGYNTDAAGFLKAVKSCGVTPEGQNIVVLGAGGASRAITSILAQEGIRKLAILNRKLEMDWAEGIAQAVKKDSGTETVALDLEAGNLEEALAQADILVNATSIGMSPEVGETLVPARLLRAGMFVVDIIYNPAKTRLLQEAEAAGAQVMSGMDMLVWQGALAFEMWTGKPAPFEIMKEAAVQALKGYED
jgi:shikimate dehydrogenase